MAGAAAPTPHTVVHISAARLHLTAVAFMPLRYPDQANRPRQNLPPQKRVQQTQTTKRVQVGWAPTSTGSHHLHALIGKGRRSALSTPRPPITIYPESASFCSFCSRHPVPQSKHCTQVWHESGVQAAPYLNIAMCSSRGGGRPQDGQATVQGHPQPHARNNHTAE